MPAFFVKAQPGLVYEMGRPQRGPAQKPTVEPPNGKKRIYLFSGIIKFTLRSTWV